MIIQSLSKISQNDTDITPNEGFYRNIISTSPRNVTGTHGVFLPVAVPSVDECSRSIMATSQLELNTRALTERTAGSCNVILDSNLYVQDYV